MSEVYRDGSISEQMDRKSKDQMDAAKYREIQNKAQLGSAFEGGRGKGQVEGFEGGLAEAMRAAAAARSMADMAQAEMYGQAVPKGYVSPQWEEPTYEQNKRALDSLRGPAMGLAEQTGRR